MRLAKVLLALLVLAALWIPGSAKADTFTADEQAALDRGEVVRHPLPSNPDTEGYLGGTSYAVIDAAPDVVWRAMQDIAAYPRIFPKTLSAEVISDRGSRKVVKMVQGNSWLSISFYVLYRVDEANRKISWSLIEDQPHDLADTRGYWQVQPYGEGQSLVTYVNVISIGTGAVLALFEEQIQNGLLGVPGNLRDWVQGPNGARYREGSATATNQ
jgi:ribosome-associated toxin RatA of RatAB toxin-antitoxin module